jgi:hypothetical protein
MLTDINPTHSYRNITEKKFYILLKKVIQDDYPQEKISHNHDHEESIF